MSLLLILGGPNYFRIGGELSKTRTPENAKTTIFKTVIISLQEARVHVISKGKTGLTHEILVVFQVFKRFSGSG